MYITELKIISNLTGVLLFNIISSYERRLLPLLF
jgi:hypothetical protein